MIYNMGQNKKIVFIFNLDALFVADLEYLIDGKIS